MSILTELKNAGEKRFDKYPEIFDYPYLIQEVNEPVFVGDFSLTAVKGGRRWLRSSGCIKPFGFQQTVTEITRDYLSAKYTLPRKIRNELLDNVRDIPAMPLYSKCGHYGDCTYIDIKSAYWQIARCVGWDVCYQPLKYVGAQSDLSDAPEFLVKQKLFRASLVSMCRSRDSFIYDGHGKMTAHKMRNVFINHQLVRLVYDVLNGVAWNMFLSDADPVYIHTDGFIVPTKKLQQAYEVLESWGLRAGIKGQGTTTIWGVGSYRVGFMHTKRQGNNMSLNGLRSCKYEWLRDRFRKFAARWDVYN